MKYIRENDRMASVHFPSFADFLECDIPEGPNHAWASRLRKGQRGHDRRNFSWFGPHATMSTDALNNAIVGHEELGKMVRNMWSELDSATGKRTTDYEQKVAVVKRKKRRGDYGDELDIHKVYQGQLDTAWSRTERIVQDVSHPLITLFIDYGGNCDVDARHTLWRAAVTTRLVSELEAAGKSVKVVVGAVNSRQFTSSSAPGAATASVVVKDFNQPLSHERLACMTHIGFFRSFGFIAANMFKHRNTGHLGYNVSVEKYVPIQLQEEIDEGHTRFVHIGRAVNLPGAVRELENAYEQLKKYSEVA